MWSLRAAGATLCVLGLTAFANALYYIDDQDSSITYNSSAGVGYNKKWLKYSHENSNLLAVSVNETFLSIKLHPIRNVTHPTIAASPYHSTHGYHPVRRSRHRRHLQHNHLPRQRPCDQPFRIQRYQGPSRGLQCHFVRHSRPELDHTHRARGTRPQRLETAVRLCRRDGRPTAQQEWRCCGSGVFSVGCGTSTRTAGGLFLVAISEGVVPGVVFAFASAPPNGIAHICLCFRYVTPTVNWVALHISYFCTQRTRAFS
ncbi:hypothetical protein B0H14DRAFT_750446 [Mycena olivaceomarginata]|nr:hypothetical protein B0H14DRAFT_750446 [Mycena olivaceomarginata]